MAEKRASDALQSDIWNGDRLAAIAAEREASRAEVEKLKAERDEAREVARQESDLRHHQVNSLTAERDQLRAELERVKISRG